MSSRKLNFLSSETKRNWSLTFKISKINVIKVLYNISYIVRFLNDVFTFYDRLMWILMCDYHRDYIRWENQAITKSANPIGPIVRASIKDRSKNYFSKLFPMAVQMGNNSDRLFHNTLHKIALRLFWDVLWEAFIDSKRLEFPL